MPNYRRVHAPAGMFFFYIVMHGRRRMLTTPLALHMLRKAAREVRARLPFTVVAAVMLPDHQHWWYGDEWQYFEQRPGSGG